MKALSLVSVLFTIIFLISVQKIQAYDTNLALQLAYMCSISYQAKQSIDNWSCQPCKKYQVQNPKSFYGQAGNIQGFTGYSKQRDAIYVAFRGSQDIKNWIINIEAKQVLYPECLGCKVHSGFWIGFQTIQKQMNSQISELKSLHPTAKIYVTGHSLGGALSLLATVSIKRHHGHVDQTYALGCPRVGNSKYAKYIQNNFNGVRIIHYADIVPHVPPSEMDFQHPFQQAWYQQDMQSYQICQAQKGCANSISALKYSTSDHSLETYYLLIKSQEQWYKTLYYGLIQKKIKFNHNMRNEFQQIQENEKERQKLMVQNTLNELRQQSFVEANQQ